MKKKNYKEMAEKLMSKAIKFAKDGKIDEKALEFARAYAKLARTPKACEQWITALDEVGASDECAVPFREKLIALQESQAVTAEAAAATETPTEVVAE